MVWAVLSTGINYFAGLGLALLLNKKCVKGKAIWRAFPVLAYAIPGFITLLGFKFMFSYGGPINYYIQKMGGEAIGFLGIDSTWISRLIGLLVNAWISVPSIMLMRRVFYQISIPTITKQRKLTGQMRGKFLQRSLCLTWSLRQLPCSFRSL